MIEATISRYAFISFLDILQTILEGYLLSKSLEHWDVIKRQALGNFLGGGLRAL